MFPYFRKPPSEKGAQKAGLVLLLIQCELKVLGMSGWGAGGRKVVCLVRSWGRKVVRKFRQFGL